MTPLEIVISVAVALLTGLFGGYTVWDKIHNRTPRLALRIECLFENKDSSGCPNLHAGTAGPVEERFLQLVISNAGDKPACMLHATSSMKVPQFVVDTGRTLGSRAMNDTLVIEPESKPTMRMVKIDHKAIIDSGGRGHWLKLRFVGLRPILVSGQALHDCLVNGTNWNWSNAAH